MLKGTPTRTVSQRAYEALKHAILLGDIPAGTRLVETYYAKRLNISRTPLREAIRLLELDDLVAFAPTRGAVVTGFTLSDIEETFTIRNALMMLLLPGIVQNCGDRHLAQLRGYLAQMDLSQAAEDSEKLSVQNRAFHKTLEHISDRKRILRVVDSQEELIIRFSASAIALIVHHSKAQEEHHQMVELLERKDEAALAALMRHHLDESKESCLAAFRQKAAQKENLP